MADSFFLHDIRLISYVEGASDFHPLITNRSLQSVLSFYTKYNNYVVIYGRLYYHILARNEMNRLAIPS
jgi:hypothetical protein